MNLGGYDIGVCDWSLRQKSMSDLIATLDALKLDHLQISLAPLLKMEQEQREAEINLLAEAEVAVTAGMIGFEGENYSSIGVIRKTGGFLPDETWDVRRDLAIRAGELAGAIGVDRITLHLGFLPPGSDSGYAKLMARATEIAQSYAANGVELLLETGQERASDLLSFINDLNMKNVGVNLDPANLIMYGAGDPVEAVETLGRHIRHVHIKDATVSPNPGIEWGKEASFGYGDIDHLAFAKALKAAEYTGPLVIECETVGSFDRIHAAVAKLTDLFT